MKKITYLSLLLILIASINIKADIFPKQNQIGFGLSTGNFKNFEGSDHSADFKLGILAEYGLTDNFIISFEYSDTEFEGINTDKYTLGAKYHFDYSENTRILLDASVSEMESKLKHLDGTSIELGASLYYTVYKSTKTYFGFSYSREGSPKLKFNDNLLEHLGVRVTVTDNLNISFDYEFSQKALTYSAEFLFGI